MGAYMGDPGWRGPPQRTVHTDEYQLGDEDSSFDEVAPGTHRQNASGDQSPARQSSVPR
jgi:hypothetical protein